MKTVALDAMGGDSAPGPEIDGAIEFVRTGAGRVILVGDEARLKEELRARSASDLGIELRHASQVITMHDAPSVAVKRKKDSSLRIATDCVARGDADALVSAGNSGAVMASALFVLKRIKGVDRPAILTTFPTKQREAVLLDMGANVECQPLHLVQFAVLGAYYTRFYHRRERPRVGLLSNGAEAHKGTELTRETHRLLTTNPLSFDYAGYVEGRDIFRGTIDVIVCDGFSGNLVLKVSEGVAEAVRDIAEDVITSHIWTKLFAIPLLPAFRELKRRVDYAEWGGAPLLGVRKPVFICHGGSTAKAIKNALVAASRYAEQNVMAMLEQGIDDHRELFQAARADRVKTTKPGGSEGQGPSSREEEETHETSENRGNRASGSAKSGDEFRSGKDGGDHRRMDHRANWH